MRECITTFFVYTKMIYFTNMEAQNEPYINEQYELK